MFEFKNNSLYISRYESGNITINNKNGTFKSGESVELRVYEKNGLDSEPLIYIAKTLSEDSSSVVLNFSGDETNNLGAPSNEVEEFWFEIRLSGSKMLLGYDTEGPKIFYLYPAGIDRIEV